MSVDVISMSSLGKMGRFANQMIQYMFLKTYAREHQLEVQTPPWIGNKLFGIHDAPIEKQLPEFSDPYDKCPNRSIIPNLSRPIRNVDLLGFFQYHSSYYAPHREYIQQLFQPIESIAAPLEEGVQRIQDLGRTVIALHVRRGDYGYECFYRTPCQWYLDLLDCIWDQFDAPVLYIASDEVESLDNRFKEFGYHTAESLGMHVPQAAYFADFYMLSRADAVVIPNSTFSFVAAMLNRNLQQAWRSKLSDPLGTPPFFQFDPWNADMFDDSARVQDFPHIEGIGKPPKRRLFSNWSIPRLGRKAA